MLAKRRRHGHQSQTTRSLCDDVLTAFERACREEDWQVAEHLLKALETIAQREDAEEGLQRAYLEPVMN